MASESKNGSRAQPAGANGSVPNEDLEIAIIGSGFAGLGAACRLRQEGVEDFVVLERANDLGGTWRDNHYPGLCCDIPSHVYSFSFELNPHWTRGFAPGWEIQDYLHAAAEKHGVLPHLRYGHEVLEAAWDPAVRRWRITTGRGRFTARFLISAAGGLSDPMTPDIDGIKDFEGTMFHSARWDHDHDLAGERVAVIGTGASAIQFVPQIQPEVARLHLFQRTPAWVVPRFDHEISRIEHVLLDRIPSAPRAVRAALYWLMEARVVGFRRPRLMKLVGKLALHHLRRQVRDPEKRRKLTPDYTLGCKRVLISDDYYPALDQPNVEIVTEPISKVRQHSIVCADGSEREVDTLILGTGFHITDPPIAARIRDGEGRSLADHWTPSLEAYLGTTVAGFPNLFFLVGPNTGLGHNSIVFMIESQLNYVLDALRTLRLRGAETFEVRREAQEAYNRELQDGFEGTVWTAAHCSSWYLDDTGRNTTLWPSYSWSFRRRTRSFDPHAYVLDEGSRAADPERELVAG